MLPMFLTPILAALAPSLMRMITKSDNAAQVTQEVADAVLKVTGTAPQTVEEATALTRQIQADPEVQARLVTELQRIEQQELEALLQDRQNARSRDLVIQKETGANHRANVMLAMAFAAIIAIVATLFYLYKETPTTHQNAEILGTIIGFLTGIGGMFARNIGSAFDFEFGSSRGSKSKSAEIASLTKQVNDLTHVPVTPIGIAANVAADVIADTGKLDAFRKRMSGS